MKSEKSIFILLAGISAVALILIVLFAINESKQTSQASVPSYSANDQSKPKVETSETSSDLGKMSVKDEKSATFSIKNTGDKPLALSSISTSCDCTFAKVLINDVESPEFSMHDRNTWVGTIDPAKEAKLLVTYRPSIMPVSGSVTRDVYIQTNDPKLPKLTFTIKAFVE